MTGFESLSKKKGVRWIWKMLHLKS